MLHINFPINYALGGLDTDDDDDDENLDASNSNIVESM